MFMKTYISTLILAICLFNSCKQCESVQSEGRVEFNQQIEVQDFDNQFMYNITEGEKLLFVLEIFDNACEADINPENTEILTFEVAPDVESFSFVDENLADTAKCFYEETIGTFNKQNVPVLSGSITGEKVSEKRWRVDIDVLASSGPFSSYAKPVKLTEDFVEP